MLLYFLYSHCGDWITQEKALNLSQGNDFVFLKLALWYFLSASILPSRWCWYLRLISFSWKGQRYKDLSFDPHEFYLALQLRCLQITDASFQVYHFNLTIFFSKWKKNQLTYLAVSSVVFGLPWSLILFWTSTWFMTEQ